MFGWLKKKEVEVVQEAPKRVVSAYKPQEDVIAIFFPVVEFVSEDFDDTVYLKDMKYSLRKNNKRLARALNKWLKEGLVQVSIIKEDPLIEIVKEG